MMTVHATLDRLRQIAERESRTASPRAAALLWRVIDQASHELIGTPAPELAPGRYMTKCRRCGCQTEHYASTGTCVPCVTLDKRASRAKKSAKT